jgi:hypothetical protein
MRKKLIYSIIDILNLIPLDREGRPFKLPEKPGGNIQLFKT